MCASDKGSAVLHLVQGAVVLGGEGGEWGGMRVWRGVGMKGGGGGEGTCRQTPCPRCCLSLWEGQHWHKCVYVGGEGQASAGNSPAPTATIPAWAPLRAPGKSMRAHGGGEGENRSPAPLMYATGPYHQ